MKRRSVNARGLAVGLLLALAILVGFTTLLVPLERLLVTLSQKAILQYGSLARIVRRQTFEEERLRVIAKRADEFQDVFLLNRTLPQGARIVSGNTLVGVVDEAGRLRAISAPFFTIAGVFARSGIPTTFEGRGAGVLEVKLPRGSDVVVGDEVYVDDAHTLLVGYVARLYETPSDPFVTIIILNPINLTTLGVVEVAS